MRTTLKRGCAAAAALAAFAAAGCTPERGEREELPEPTPVAAADDDSESDAETEEPEDEESETEAPEDEAEEPEEDEGDEEEDAPAPPDCTDAALQASPGFERFAFHDGCRGSFARPGVPNSGVIALAWWNGEHWELVEPDGIWDGMGMQRPCHNREKLEDLGVPGELIKQEAICGEYGPGQEPQN